MQPPGKEVPVERLRGTCDPKSLGFKTTEELDSLDGGIVAQERALKALRFGLRIKEIDYNIFVAGFPRTGKTYIIKSYLEEVARKEPTPPEWIYVHNFKQPDAPRAISVPVGHARALAGDMEEVIQDLRRRIPEVFDSEEYQIRREEIAKKVQEERGAILQDLQAKAAKRGFLLQLRPEGMVIHPARDGSPLTEEELRGLDEESKERIMKESQLLQSEMNHAVRRIRKVEKGATEEEKNLDKRVALSVVGHIFDDLEEKYRGMPQVLEYLGEVKEDILRNIDDFKGKTAEKHALFSASAPETSFDRYKVNVFVDHTETKGAPVVIETNPVYGNLFGAIERKVQFGALVTDFTLIRAGSLHRANGGYLVVQAADLLNSPISWEALKRAIRNAEIKIEDPAEQLGLFAAKGLVPQPVPLKIKVILIGSPYIYQILYDYDDQFRKIFKIKVHMDDLMDRGEKEIDQYAAYICGLRKKWDLRHLDSTGVARLIEYGSEIAGDSQKLTLKLSEIEDVVREANFWAEEDRSDLITAEYVERAISEKIQRSNLWEEKIQEMIARGTLKIQTTGRVIGQVNGLSIYDLGDYSFGKPTRITASISVGREGVIDIDREAKMSGNLHTKGVMILSGYLKSMFAQDKPMALSASLCFEQSYEEVEGDSASSAELFALLSALAEVPVRQDLAVTGAVSQRGEILPIGGVTRKIEGFYDICRLQGLTGNQGVIIPEGNVKDLMLKKEVVEAVRQGRFHIYPVSTVDEGIELLTGMRAPSRRGEDGFEKGSFYELVDRQLFRMNEIAKEFGKEEEEEERCYGDLDEE